MFHKKINHLKLIVILQFSLASSVIAEPFQSQHQPIFDAHIHYSQDVWEAISPQDAIHRLREAGITRALVSSSSDEGTQSLYQAAPEFVIPVLRPYRQRGTIKTWMHDETVIPYLKERLAKYRYVAIGEFHIDNEQANLPVIRELVHLAKQHKLMLHVHSDAEAISYIFEQDPDAKILWAHAGFEYAYVIRDMFEKHDNLWADLSFRRDIFTNNHFLQDWQALLIDHADRFMLGIDTYTPQRWLRVDTVMRWQRQLLNALPNEVARKIGHENGKRVFASRFNKD